MLIVDKHQSPSEVESWVNEEYGQKVLDVFKRKAIEMPELGVHDILQLALETEKKQEVVVSQNDLSRPFDSEKFFMPFWESLDDSNDSTK